MINMSFTECQATVNSINEPLFKSVIRTKHFLYHLHLLISKNRINRIALFPMVIQMNMLYGLLYLLSETKGRIMLEARNIFLINATDKFLCVVETEVHLMSNTPRFVVGNLLFDSHKICIRSMHSLVSQETNLSQLQRVNKFNDLRHYKKMSNLRRLIL